MTLRAQFVKDVRARMTALGMTQRDLAAKAKVSQPVIARLLSGKHAPTTDTIEQVAKALGCVAKISLAKS